jgi:hypothetical protein
VIEGSAMWKLLIDAYNSNGVVHKVINIFCLGFIKHLLDNQASHAADKKKSIY